MRKLMFIFFLIGLFGLISCSINSSRQIVKTYWYMDNGDSIIQTKFEVRGQLMNGYCKNYYKNGNLKSVCYYKNNRLMSVKKVLDTLGNPLYFGKIKNGNGYTIIYNNEGVREYSGLFKEGVMHGWWKNYDFRGNLNDSSYYNNGENEQLPGIIFFQY